MDIKSWILLVGTLLIAAVICHGFWTAYRARKNDVLVDIETNLPDDELDDMLLLSGELPNGGARVTPTEGYDALRVKERLPAAFDAQAPNFDSGALNASSLALDPLEDALIALDDAMAFTQEGLTLQADASDEGDFDAGYQPQQATLDLELGALEERYAARAAASSPRLGGAGKTLGAPLLTDTTLAGAGAETAGLPPLPPKKLITPEIAGTPPRKQFEPPLPEEREAQRIADLEHAAHREAERLKSEQAARAREAELQARAETERLRKMEQEQREAEARADAQARAEARAKAKEAARQDALERAREKAEQEARLAAQREAQAIREVRREPEQLSLTPEPVVEFPETSGRKAPSQPPAEELVVLNVIAKTRPFQGVDVLELFLRNGIKFGDMNIFHRIDPVTKASQYSIASVTEPGYFDLRTMETLQFRGLCLFMQLPCSGQATKVFTDMLTVADKLARQLDAEVCDEQYNRLTRQSTEHYRQRVAEFTRRHMSKRA